MIDDATKDFQSQVLLNKFCRNRTKREEEAEKEEEGFELISKDIRP